MFPQTGEMESMKSPVKRREKPDGGPFALGFWLGGVRQRAKWKKEGNG